MKIVQALEDSNILLNRVIKTIKNETNEQKGGFLSMLLGTLGATLLGNLLSEKGNVRAGSGNKKGKGIVIQKYFNFEIQKYYENEPISFSRDNMPKKIKDGAYVVNLDDYADVATH